MHPAAAQAPEQEAVHGAEAQLAPFGPLAGAGHLVEDPAQLAGREVGVDQQAGAGRHLRLMAGGLEPGTEIRGAPVLPDDGRMDGLAGRRIPYQGGFTLVGDADGTQVAGLQSGIGQGLAAHRQGALPEVLGGVLDPAVLREMLGKFLLGAGYRATAGGEDDRPGAGGALVDGKEVVAHGISVSRARSGQRWPGSAGPAPRRSAPPPDPGARR